MRSEMDGREFGQSPTGGSDIGNGLFAVRLSPIQLTIILIIIRQTVICQHCSFLTRSAIAANPMY